MLSCDDLLPRCPRRVLVAGVSGSGKTTLARRIAELRNLEHTEIDALFHGPDWTPRPEFMHDVRRLVASDGWVTEWQYTAVRAVLAEHADLMVWLDLPYWRRTFPRVVRRTVRRWALREELWNGNREPAIWQVFTDPGHVIRWSITTRNRLATAVLEVAATHPQLVVVRLRSPREVDRWLERMATNA